MSRPERVSLRRKTEPKKATPKPVDDGPITAAEAVEIRRRLKELETKVFPAERVFEEGLCMYTGEPDGGDCDRSGVYPYQKGCKGESCVRDGRAYYRERYAKRKKDT